MIRLSINEYATRLGYEDIPQYMLDERFIQLDIQTNKWKTDWEILEKLLLAYGWGINWLQQYKKDKPIIYPTLENNPYIVIN